MNVSATPSRQPRQGHRTGFGTPRPAVREGFEQFPTYQTWEGPLVAMFDGDYAIILSNGQGTDVILANGCGAFEHNGKRGHTMADVSTALDGLLGPGAGSEILGLNRIVEVDGVPMDDPQRRVRMTVPLDTLAGLIDRNKIELPDCEDF